MAGVGSQKTFLATSFKLFKFLKEILFLYQHEVALEKNKDKGEGNHYQRKKQGREFLSLLKPFPEEPFKPKKNYQRVFWVLGVTKYTAKTVPFRCYIFNHNSRNNWLPSYYTC